MSITMKQIVEEEVEDMTEMMELLYLEAIVKKRIRRLGMNYGS